jgi:hypothetical protein
VDIRAAEVVIGVIMTVATVLAQTHAEKDGGKKKIHTHRHAVGVDLKLNEKPP